VGTVLFQTIKNALFNQQAEPLGEGSFLNKEFRCISYGFADEMYEGTDWPAGTAGGQTSVSRRALGRTLRYAP
jgi:hypothetical protein